MANKNEDLRKANKAKKYEFYTQLSDIEKEQNNSLIREKYGSDYRNLSL